MSQGKLFFSDQIITKYQLFFFLRSGGMSNELNNIISKAADGVYEGVAIGGDRYPGSTFMDHLLRYEADPKIKILVLLGEVGGREEYDVCEAIKTKKISKPLIAWCIGELFSIFLRTYNFVFIFFPNEQTYHYFISSLFGAEKVTS